MVGASSVVLGLHKALVQSPDTVCSPRRIPAHDCSKTPALQFSHVFGVKRRKSYGFNLIHMFAVHIWQNSFLVGTFFAVVATHYISKESPLMLNYCSTTHYATDSI